MLASAGMSHCLKEKYILFTTRRNEYQWIKLVEEEMITVAKCNGKTSQHETVIHLNFVHKSYLLSTYMIASILFLFSSM